jgi:hypothetical protein
MAEDYEILPHKLLEDLKFEVEALKKKITEPDTKANELILEIESMKDSIHELTLIFQKALEESKADLDIDKTLATMKEKMDAVVSQNETIARGMIAISDKLEDFMKKPQGPPPGIKHTMGAPSGPPRMAPPPMPSMNPPMRSPLMDLPPPPPAPGGRRGIFK